MIERYHIQNSVSDFLWIPGPFLPLWTTDLEDFGDKR